MTPRNWAEKKAESIFTMPSNIGCYALGLKSEHARAVRIAKQYYKRYGTEGSPCELICNDILAAFQRGRTGRGR